MTEYIDKAKIPWAKVDHPEGDPWDRIVFERSINAMPSAEVVERSEYDELNEKYFKAIHNHTECLKKLHELRAKIDKAKKQITDSMNEHLGSDGMPIDEYAYCYLNALEILEENIGE